MTLQFCDDEDETMCTMPDDRSFYQKSLSLLEWDAKRLPKGWHHIIENSLIKLRAIDCKKRSRVMLSLSYRTEDGIEIQAEYDTKGGDLVVIGILRKLRERSLSTCEYCGRRNARTIFGGYDTQRLCARCETAQQVRVEWKRWVSLLGFARKSKKIDAVIEMHSLPHSLRAIIPRTYVHTLTSSGDAGQIEYLIKDELREIVPIIERMIAYADKLSPV